MKNGGKNKCCVYNFVQCLCLILQNTFDVKATALVIQNKTELQVNDALWCHPKEEPNHSHGPFPGLCPAAGMTSGSQFGQLSLQPFSKNN